MNRLIAEGKEAAAVQRKKDEAAPTLAEWKREFGNKVKVDERSGSFELNLTDRQDIRRAFEMQEGTRRVEVERGAVLQSRMKRERVARRDGHVIEFPEDMVDQVKHKVRPVGRNGIAPALRFGLSESFGKYEQGPDGLWFVWNGGWEPTKLFGGHQRNGHQRDPDDNVWVKQGEDWVLEDEVS